MPETPLTALIPYLPSRRLYAALLFGSRWITGEQIDSVERVAAMSDRQLLEVRNVGIGSVPAIREAVAKVLGPGWPPHEPKRGSDVEAWVKQARDAFLPSSRGTSDVCYIALDNLLNDYRRRADFGLTLNDDTEGVDDAQLAQ